MSFIIAGFYTKLTPYEQEITGLIKSCRNFDIKCETRGYKSRGNWINNTAIKPEFILDMMTEFPDDDIVYVDADGVVQQYPALFDTVDADLAFHYKDGKEVLSGTVFIKNNAKMVLFVKCWIAMCGHHPTLPDGKCLSMSIDKYAKSQHIKIVDLPPSYTQIYDLMCNQPPVIEHFQASRRFKKSVTTTSLIPSVIDGMKVREAGDGSFFLPRASRQLCDKLSEDFIKFPNELRWFPKEIACGDLNKVQRYFAKKNCYIVGKGPSLDRLSKRHFPNPRLPVICINESIHKVETLDLPNKVFAMQQDAWLKDTCRPEYGGLFITYACRYWYPDVPEKYVFHYSQLDLRCNNLTVIYAIALAKKFNARGLTLLCFDAAVNKKVDYGKCVGYTPDKGGNPQRFLGHRNVIEQHARPLPLDFVIPEPLASQAVGKLQQ